MLRFTEKDIQVMTRCVRPAYGGKDLELIAGLRILEKLVHCKVSGDKMPKDIGEKIENNLEVWERNKGNFVSSPVEAVLRKIVMLLPESELKPVNNPDIKRGLAKYYVQLGIMEELEAAYQTICPNRELYRDVQREVWNVPDRSKWNGRQYDYVCVWKYRNRDAHSLNIDEYSSLQTGFFAVLIDVCNRFKDKIEEKFKTTFAASIKKEFDDFKANTLQTYNRTQFFENEFTELDWGNEKVQWQKKCKTMLLLGEAGAGKTTQMEKLYWDELNSNRSAFPIWIKVQELVNNQGFNKEKLGEYLKEKLGDTLAHYYEQCMEAGFVSLYIDGLNEVTADNQELVTMQLLQAISKIRKLYPNIRICMTDRRNELDIQDNMQIYSGSSMSDDEIEEYCIRKWGEACKDEVMAFLQNNEWFSYTTVTPEKINGLADIFKQDEMPKDEEDFYFKYMDRLLYREQYIKEDLRVRTLRPALHWLTHKFTDGLDQLPAMDIIGLFEKHAGNNLSYAMGLFDLACSMPIIEKQESGLYGFVHPIYYEYFHRKNLL